MDGSVFSYTVAQSVAPCGNANRKAMKKKPSNDACMTLGLEAFGVSTPETAVIAEISLKFLLVGELISSLVRLGATTVRADSVDAVERERGLELSEFIIDLLKDHNVYLAMLFNIMQRFLVTRHCLNPMGSGHRGLLIEAKEGRNGGKSV